MREEIDSKTDRKKAYLRENTILLTRHLPALHRLPHPIVAALHEPPLELDGIAQEPIILDLDHHRLRSLLLLQLLLATRQGLQLAVELGVPALREQQEQEQARDLVPLGLRVVCGGGGGGGEQ